MKPIFQPNDDHGSFTVGNVPIIVIDPRIHMKDSHAPLVGRKPEDHLLMANNPIHLKRAIMASEKRISFAEELTVFDNLFLKE